MGLEALGEEIKKKAEAEASKIRTATESEAKSILEQAKKKKEEMIKEAKVAGTRQAKGIGRMELSAASIKARRMMTDAKEEVINGAIEDVRQGFIDFRKKDGYGRLLKKIVDDAAGELGDGLVVYAKSEDAHFVRGYDVRAIDCSAGVVLESADGKIRIDYTFDSHFNEKKSELRKTLYKETFKQ